MLRCMSSVMCPARIFGHMLSLSYLDSSLRYVSLTIFREDALKPQNETLNSSTQKRAIILTSTHIAGC